MKASKWVVIVTVMLLLGMAFLASWVAADPPNPGPAPSVVQPAALVGSSYTYQGRLLDAVGNPITSNRDITFRLFNAATGGTQLWSQLRTVSPDSQGWFSTTMSTDPSHYNGQGLWLELQVSGEASPLSPRQEILPVSYALSLRPGAQMSDNSGSSLLSIANSGSGNGLYARSVGIAGYFTSTSSYGIRAESNGWDGLRGISYGGASADNGVTGSLFGVRAGSGSHRFWIVTGLDLD